MKRHGTGSISMICGLLLACLIVIGVRGAAVIESTESYDDRTMSEAAKAALEWTKNGYAGIIAQRLQSGGDTMQAALRNARLAAARSLAVEYTLHPFNPRSMTMRALILMKQKAASAREETREEEMHGISYRV